MKYIKKYQTFLNEAYQDLSNKDFKDKYDSKFANYALNERPFHLSDEEADECKLIYGNRDVGIVYHGGKIHTIEYLNIIKSLKKGDYIKLDFKSASPSYEVAESFAFYVKSYDEYTMASEMRETMKNGAAGKFGGYVIKIKPLPKHVIIANFGEGEKPTMSAETECILKGDIEVLDIFIFEPIKKDTYLEQIKKLNPNQLFNSFFKHWLQYHKIPRPDSKILINILSNINNQNDANDFLLYFNDNITDFIFSYMTYEEFISNEFLQKTLDTIIFEKGNYYFKIKNESINVNIIKGLFDYMFKIRKTELLDYYTEVSKRPFKPFTYSKYGFSTDDAGAAIFELLLKINDPQLNKKSKAIRSLQNLMDSKLNEMVLNKHLKDISNEDMESIYYLFNSIYSLKKYLHLFDVKTLHKACQWYYNDMAFKFKPLNNEDKNKFLEYQKLLPTVIKVITNNIYENFNYKYFKKY